MVSHQIRVGEPSSFSVLPGESVQEVEYADLAGNRYYRYYMNNQEIASIHVPELMRMGHEDWWNWIRAAAAKHIATRNVLPETYGEW